MADIRIRFRLLSLPDKKAPRNAVAMRRAIGCGLQSSDPLWQPFGCISCGTMPYCYTKGNTDQQRGPQTTQRATQTTQGANRSHKVYTDDDDKEEPMRPKDGCCTTAPGCPTAHTSGSVLKKPRW